MMKKMKLMSLWMTLIIGVAATNRFRTDNNPQHIEDRHIDENYKENYDDQFDPKNNYDSYGDNSNRVSNFIGSSSNYELAAPADGVKDQSSSQEDRIVGGTQIDISTAPYQVICTLKLPNGGLAVMCGGSIISENWVVTAAHCFWVNEQYISPNQLAFRAGSTNKWNGGSLHDARQITKHPNYVHGNGRPDYDIGLVSVLTPFSLNGRTVKAIGLANREPPVGTWLLASGWGTLHDITGPQTDVLMAAQLNVLSRDECKRRKTFITERIFCATGQQAATCSGDSGGPLADNKNNILYGVTSFGPPGPCVQPNTANGFTSIAVLKGWIRQVSGI